MSKSESSPSETSMAKSEDINNDPMPSLEESLREGIGLLIEISDPLLKVSEDENPKLWKLKNNLIRTLKRYQRKC